MESKPEPKTGEFKHSHSPQFAEILERIGATLLVTTYQAGKLIVARARGGRIDTLLRSFEQPMGLAISGNKLAIGTRNQIWTFRNATDLAKQVSPSKSHDACFVPRSCHVTGDIRSHEIGWSGNELWVVNTRFSCLCTLHPDYSFVPRWQPRFVTSLTADDRCHLNGMALDPSGPQFVTALGASNSAEGWRPNKARGGCVIEVASREVILGNLSMPHSPRLYEGRLYLLESGKGQLLVFNRNSSSTEVVAQLPGYGRGMVLTENLAFIGLSKIRETSTFGGLPIAERGELKCGVVVIDLNSGEDVALLEFESDIHELFDVQLITGIRYPAFIGFQKDTVNGVFVVPPQV